MRPRDFVARSVAWRPAKLAPLALETRHRGQPGESQGVRRSVQHSAKHPLPITVSASQPS